MNRAWRFFKLNGLGTDTGRTRACPMPRYEVTGCADDSCLMIKPV